MKTILVAGLLGLAALAAFTPANAQGDAYEHQLEVHEFEGGGMHLYPEQIRANVGDTLRFIVHNPEENKVAHNVIVCGEPVDPQNLPEKSECSDRWGASPSIGPGETESFTFTVKEAGTFEYYCDILGHKTASPGMRGLLIVSGDEARNESPSLAVVATLGTLALVALALRR